MTEQTEQTAPNSVLKGQDDFLGASNRVLQRLTPLQRVAWARDCLPGGHVLSSSFGVQSAVMLHLVNQVAPGIPVVFIDTGYLFPETYRFVDRLSDRLRLNVQVYRPLVSAAWQEARHGRLWEAGIEGIEHYNQVNKVEPMARALKELQVGAWFAGLRRSQSRSRAEVPILQLKNDRFKVHPIIDWSDRDVHRYLKRHQLPYHPLWDRGYVSVGDTHTSRPLEPGMLAEETRFFGLKRECGLHE